MYTIFVCGNFSFTCLQVCLCASPGWVSTSTLTQLSEEFISQSSWWSLWWDRYRKTLSLSFSIVIQSAEVISVSCTSIKNILQLVKMNLWNSIKLCCGFRILDFQNRIALILLLKLVMIPRKVYQTEIVSNKIHLCSCVVDDVYFVSSSSGGLRQSYRCLDECLFGFCISGTCGICNCQGNYAHNIVITKGINTIFPLIVARLLFGDMFWNMLRHELLFIFFPSLKTSLIFIWLMRH